MTTSRSAAVASPRAPSPTYFPALDGIRAVAFLMVFAIHYLQIPWGWTGVNIFFVLSGFLITGILYDTQDHPHRVRNFYLRRTLRIFPLYYGVMLLVVLAYPIFHWAWNWNWLIWPAYLGNFLRFHPPGAVNSPYDLLDAAQPLSRTFPSVKLVFGHFWSLCVEEQFYLAWPWVVFAIADRRKLIRICVAGMVAMPVLRMVGSHVFSPATLDAGVLLAATPFPFDALLLGSLIALVRRGPAAGRVLPVARIAFPALIAAFVVWLALHPGARHISAPYPYPMWGFTWGVTLIDILAACLIVLALERGSLTFRLFNLRPLRWLGRISYGAYIFHHIFYNEFIRVAPRLTGHWRIATAMMGFSSTILLAWASFRWFESPFIRLKDRYTLSASPATPARQGAMEPMRKVA